mmetsp:Transcript_38296/g.78043  ORF Transcript_38296/g.78043 Transcript_38296/m.78043 type:complete len:228 (+) Transcript_38296:321-1004(+)
MLLPSLLVPVGDRTTSCMIGFFSATSSPVAATVALCASSLFASDFDGASFWGTGCMTPLFGPVPTFSSSSSSSFVVPIGRKSLDAFSSTSFGSASPTSTSSSSGTAATSFLRVILSSLRTTSYSFMACSETSSVSTERTVSEVSIEVSCVALDATVSTSNDSVLLMVLSFGSGGTAMCILLMLSLTGPTSSINLGTSLVAIGARDADSFSSSSFSPPRLSTDRRTFQ